MQKLDRYGADHFGRLKKVMLHSPGKALRRVTENNRLFYLFDQVPDCGRYLAEHAAYQRLLEDNGVEVAELSSLITGSGELVSYLPNLAYLNDIAVVTGKGAVLSSMCPGGRQYEEIVVREALTALGVPILHAFEPGEQFEGFIPLSPGTLFVADTERHSRESAERFFRFALRHFEEVLYVEIPKARRFMHPDMIFNLVSDQLAVYFPPAFLRCWSIRKNGWQSVDFTVWMKQRQVELVPVSDQEQQNWGTSFVPLEANHILHYDISLKPETQARLESMGVRFTLFHPDALLAGGGSLRCLTLMLLRE